MTSQNERFYLQQEDGILKLFKKESREKVFVDFLHPIIQKRLKTLGKNQPLMKAIQIQKGLSILDATAGLGKDMLGFAFMGAKVLAIEENEIVYSLLQDGLNRAWQDTSFQKRFSENIEILHANSLEYLNSLKPDYYPDVVYLDPMYPQIEKTAKSKKDMDFLKELLGPTENLKELLEVSIMKSKKRVVLKRPHDAPFLLGKPQHSFQSKLVRFDMYLSKCRV